MLGHLAPGAKESTECCRKFLKADEAPGPFEPVLVCTDSAPDSSKRSRSVCPLHSGGGPWRVSSETSWARGRDAGGPR